MIHIARVPATICLLGLLTVLPGTLHAQQASRSDQNRTATNDPNEVIHPSMLQGLDYRSLRFSRGGRATAVAGVPTDQMTYYLGASGGGVWKTSDAGMTWSPLTDGQIEAGSIGAIAVAHSDPNIIYVGTGSACPRGNVSAGVGMYRSSDAGKSWKHIGLRTAGQIGKIRVHPSDPHLLYVAVLGNVFGASTDRGVYRSKDGGTTWQNILFVSDRTGAVDLAMDATNPRVLYASMWTAERKPWTIHSGSREGGLFKSTDGGDTWTKLTGGLPVDVMVGRTGVAVSPANPDRVWALVEAAENRGGLYRSDDAGQTWQRINAEHRLQWRAWYYMHLAADPRDPNVVYALNVFILKSTDGGRSFGILNMPHADNHDLWINPHNPRAMVHASDGGASVSLTGGVRWTSQSNQPTAEIYRVTTDSSFPYRVYGAQQDNSAVSVSSMEPPAFDGSGASFTDIGGCESGHIAVDPHRPTIVYAGCYGGGLTKIDTASRVIDSVRIYPELQMGQRASDLKYRFQWNFPVRISRHTPDVVYATSQYVHRSRDGGHSWDVISPDLTRNDKTKQDYSGGTGVTRDSTTVEVYGTIFAFEESPGTAGLLWAGSDDGRVHVSHDGGGRWTDVTPKDMPDYGCVNSIDASSHAPGRATIAVYRYRQNDFTPYIFQTDDYGKSWKRLTNRRNGIAPMHFVRVVREDPDRKGLLYAGTEYGMYVSIDNGDHWQPFQLNLPVTPITDLKIHQTDLIVSTQGRGFWVLDDLSPLHQIPKATGAHETFLLTPRDAFRTRNTSIYYYLADVPAEEVKLQITDSGGRVISTYSGKPGDRSPAPSMPAGLPPEFAILFARPVVTLNRGMNKLTWNLTEDAIVKMPPGLVVSTGSGPGGPRVVPGTYQVRLSIGSWSQTQPINVKPDPRVSTTQADYEQQYRLIKDVSSRLNNLYDALARLRDVRRQAADLGRRVEKAGMGDDLSRAATLMSERLASVEQSMTQVQGEGALDVYNFPGMLDSQILEVHSELTADELKVSRGTIERWADLEPIVAATLRRCEELIRTEVAVFNTLARSRNIDPVVIR